MATSTAQVLRFIADSPTRVTFGGLRRHFCPTDRCHPKELKRLVARLIKTGQLCYTYHYGNSFIEISYEQPRSVSEHVVIKPPLSSLKALPGQWTVSLGRGAAFGGGDHPTTRLAIQLIDAILHWPSGQGRRHAWRALDIGTGSGVLAIVAAKMGVGFVCGIDTDPCAVFEASDNVRLNRLEDRVDILHDDLNSVSGFYDLVFANLRMPTLFDLWSVLKKKVADRCILVFSGLKSEEAKPICEFYEAAGFYRHQKRSEKGWSALCLTRGSFFNESTDLID
jgi:ribosomal protein L11 methyltransferase